MTETSPAAEVESDLCTHHDLLPLTADMLRANEIFTSVVSAEPIFRSRIQVGSQQAIAILDGGSDRSLIASHLVGKNEIKPCTQVIHASGIACCTLSEE